MSQPRDVTDQPKVSCVIPARDAAAFVGEAIDSVLAQRYPGDRIEVIVVDDGSVDSTPEILDGYGERIRRIHHQHARGVDAAVEAGIAACTGDLITLMGADDAFTPDRYRVMTRAFAKNPDAGLVYGDMTVIDEQGRVLARSFNQASGIVPISGRMLGRLVCGNFISAGAMMFRADLTERILPFPDHVGVHDWWIALQAARVGPIVAVPRSLYRYRRHGGNLNLGRTGRSRLPLLEREVPLRRWLLRTIDIDEVGAHAMRLALRAFDAQIGQVAKLAEQPASALVNQMTGDRDAWLAAMGEASEALDRGDLSAAMGALIRAAAERPDDTESRDLISGLAPHLDATAAAA